MKDKVREIFDKAERSGATLSEVRKQVENFLTITINDVSETVFDALGLDPDTWRDFADRTWEEVKRLYGVSPPYAKISQVIKVFWDLAPNPAYAMYAMFKWGQMTKHSPMVVHIIVDDTEDKGETHGPVGLA